MKISLGILLLFMAITGNSYAQDSLQNDSLYANTFKWKAASFAFGEVKFQYERKISRNKSFAVEAGYASNLNGPFTFHFDRYPKKTMLELGAEFRIYTGGQALKNFYFGFFYEFMLASIKNRGHNLDFSEYYSTDNSTYTNGLGFILGRQWLVSNHWSIDFNAGIGTSINYTKETKTGYNLSEGNYNRESYSSNSVSIPAFNISVGYRF